MPEPAIEPRLPERDSRDPGVPVGPPARGWIAPVALVVSLLAAAGAGWALLRPAPPPPAPPGVFAGNPASSDAKAEACRGVKLVVEGVSLQSRANLGEDPVALETVAANTRLAMAGGAAYLRDTTPSNTPDDLAVPISTLAKQLQDAAQHYFAGQTSSLPEQADRLRAAADTTTTLAELCK